MRKHVNTVATIVVGLTFFVCPIATPNSHEASAADQDDMATRAAASAAATRFLNVGKSKVADPQEQQQRGILAVRRVAEAAKAAQREAIVDALTENVITIEQYRRGQTRETVTGKVFRERLRRLTEMAAPQDTVVIYTHSHGRKNGFEDSQPLGGIVMDLPVRQPEHGGALLWDEYANLLLKIPAKNVVVLTMSCFSGGLVEYLNSPPVLDRWEDRRQKEGRNLIVLTSQNERLTSGPIVKDKEVVNPFTYAVARALEGEADGFALAAGKPVPGQRKDSRLSVGEVIDFILYTTENTDSETTQRRNTARPQLTGSFDRCDVLFAQIQGPGPDTRNNNTAQQDAPADADKPRR